MTSARSRQSSTPRSDTNATQSLLGHGLSVMPSALRHRRIVRSTHTSDSAPTSCPVRRRRSDATSPSRSELPILHEASGPAAFLHSSRSRAPNRDTANLLFHSRRFGRYTAPRRRRRSPTASTARRRTVRGSRPSEPSVIQASNADGTTTARSPRATRARLRDSTSAAAITTDRRSRRSSYPMPRARRERDDHDRPARRSPRGAP